MQFEIIFLLGNGKEVNMDVFDKDLSISPKTVFRLHAGLLVDRQSMQEWYKSWGVCSSQKVGILALFHNDYKKLEKDE